MIALRTSRRPAMRTLPMATPPCISSLRSAELSSRNMLPSRVASSRLSAGPPGATICAPERSRPRRSRRPLPSRPGRRGEPVRASSKSCAPSTTGAVSNSHPSNLSGNGTTSPVRSSSPVTMALVSRSPRGSIPPLSSWQHLRSTAARTMRLRPSAIPSSTTPRCPALSSSASSISPIRRLSRDQPGGVYRLPRGSHHGPFGKGKKSPLNPPPMNGRDPKYGQAWLEVAGWHAGSRWTGAWPFGAGPGGAADWACHGSAGARSSP